MIAIGTANLLLAMTNGVADASESRARGPPAHSGHHWIEHEHFGLGFNVPG